jgi:hypothetical protein
MGALFGHAASLSTLCVCEAYTVITNQQKNFRDVGIERICVLPGVAHLHFLKVNERHGTAVRPKNMSVGTFSLLDLLCNRFVNLASAVRQVHLSWVCRGSFRALYALRIKPLSFNASNCTPRSRRGWQSRAWARYDSPVVLTCPH